MRFAKTFQALGYDFQIQGLAEDCQGASEPCESRKTQSKLYV